MSVRTRLTAGAVCVGLMVAGGGLGPSAVSAAETTTTVSLISKGAGWKFHNKGTNLGSAWRSVTYRDSGWSSGSGRLGAGRKDIDKYIGRARPTAYFRRAFTVNDPALMTSATLRLRRDDGVVVFLNGREVARQNMPTGRITYSTSSKSLDRSNGTTTYSIPVSPKLMVKGRNVLAVEVHQFRKGSWMSRDVMFRADLSATVGTAAPRAAPPPPPPPADHAAADHGHPRRVEVGRWR